MLQEYDFKIVHKTRLVNMDVNGLIGIHAQAKRIL